MTMQVDKARLDEMLDATDRDMIARGDRVGARLARDLLEVFDAYRSLRSTEGKEGVCAYPECTCSSNCEDHKFPTIAGAYAAAVAAVRSFDDAANVEETNWTGWGEQTVPPAATMRRLKAEQAHRAIRDADPEVYAALTRSPE